MESEVEQGVKNLRDTADMMRKYKAASIEASELDWAAATIERLQARVGELEAGVREARGALSPIADALFHYVPEGTGLEFASPADMRLDDESQLTIGDLQIAQVTYDRLDWLLNKETASCAPVDEGER